MSQHAPSSATCLLQVLVHPFSAIVSVAVNEPAPVAATVTLDWLLGPTMTPLPETSQLCVEPAVAVEMNSLVEVTQTELGPSTVQCGVGLMVTDLLQVLVQPSSTVLTVRVY